MQPDPQWLEQGDVITDDVVGNRQQQVLRPGDEGSKTTLCRGVAAELHLLA